MLPRSFYINIMFTQFAIYRLVFFCKKIEEWMAERNIRLDHSKKTINEILLHLPIGVMVFDSKFQKLKLVNPSMGKLFGQYKEE